MPLTQTEHYVASAACFIGGTLSVVTHLWLLFDFLPMIKICKSLRSLHVQLALANLFTVTFFFVGAVSHFEQAWIFGDTACKFYIFWCKLTPISAVSVLAVCLYGEYQHATDPSLEKKNVSYKGLTMLAWGYGALWGCLALTWAQYGQEPAGFTCTVIWYRVQPYVTYLSTIGFGIPLLIAACIAYSLWSKGLLIDNPMGQAAVGLLMTMTIQFGAYACGYVAVCLGYQLSLHVIALAMIWTKVLGVCHPFVYSHMLSASPEKED